MSASLASSFVPVNNPNSELGGAAYSRTAGAPVNVASGLPSNPGLAASAQNIPIPDQLYNVAGKMSDPTIQYTRLVAMSSKPQRDATEGLDNPGTLGWVIAYDSAVGLGYTMHQLSTANGGANTFHGDVVALQGATLRRIADEGMVASMATHNYVTRPEKPDVLGLDTNQLARYKEVFGNVERQAITHTINANSSGALDNYEEVGINLCPLREADFGANSENFESINLGNCSLGRFLNTNVLQENGGGKVDDLSPDGDLPKQLLMEGFELDPEKMKDSPFLLPRRYLAYSRASSAALTTTHAFPVLGSSIAAVGKMMRSGSLTQTALGPLRIEDDADKSLRKADLSYKDDVRHHLYEALFLNRNGLFSPSALGPIRPDGFTILKYSTFGMDKETERALDAAQNGVFNVAVSGKTIVMQFSKGMQRKTLAHANQNVGGYGVLLSEMENAFRLQTLPGDKLYVLVVGQVTQVSKPITPKTSGATGSSDRDKKGAHRLVNVRFELSTSYEMGLKATPGREFGIDPAEKCVLLSPASAGDYRAKGAVQKQDDDDVSGTSIKGRLKAALKQTNSPDPSNYTDDQLFGHMACVLQETNLVTEMAAEKVWIVRSGTDADDNKNKYLRLQVWEPNGETTTTEDPKGRMRTIGLRDDEVIVGGWQLGTVKDNSAARPVGAPNTPMHSASATDALTVDVKLKWVSGLDLHQKYWTRRPTPVKDNE